MSFFAIEISQVFLCIHLSILLGFSLTDGMDSPEISWAPHLVCIQFVWAAELVSSFLFSACKKGVSCFKAKFPVPANLLIIVITKECNLDI